MTRLPDWEARLHAFLDDVRDAPFVRGKHDCALFAASAVRAMTGVDPAADFRGRYSTMRGAARALRKFGAGTLAATFDARFEIIPPAFAGRGDLVFADGSVGVCVGGVAMFVGEDGSREGLIRVPRSSWTRGWRV